MATPTSRDAADVGRIEHEIAQVRDDLGRTVQEIGTRLTPAHLMQQAKQSLKETTADTTRAVAQSASDMAGAVAERTRTAALDARDQVQAHPLAAGFAVAGIGWGVWAAASAMRDRKRLIPREWDEPGVQPARRAAGFAPSTRTDLTMPILAAAAVAFLIWQGRTWE
jgi:ElaB/YqjD/DUF883 family membrane-anchored ribosome-binding protein